MSTVRWAIFLALGLLALAVRLPRLGERPMHTDESINAYITGELLAGRSFHYDPRDRHGPALYMLAEPIVRWCGAKSFSELTETEVRLPTVLTGAATVVLFGAGVEMFGFSACLIAALLFAFAPLTVYYSRYFIHETLFVAATPGLILSGWRALNRNSAAHAALAGCCAALMLACKETAVLHFFAIGLAAAIAWSMRPARVVPSAGIWLAFIGSFFIAGILLFTWGGRNWSALTDLLRAVPHLTARAGGEGHEKAFWYYATLLASNWSGRLLLALALAGIAVSFLENNRKSAPLPFISIYFLVTAGIYSAIPYKTPWLALNFWLPIALLDGLAVAWIWGKLEKSSARWWFLAPAALVAILLGRDTDKLVFKIPADEKNPYAYAHTGEDLLRLPARVEQLAQQDKLSNPRIAVVAADAWPLPWYLRKFSQVGYWQPGQETGPADLFITTTDVLAPLAERLKDFRPEYFGVRPNVLLVLWSPSKTAPGP